MNARHGTAALHTERGQSEPFLSECRMPTYAVVHVRDPNAPLRTPILHCIDSLNRARGVLDAFGDVLALADRMFDEDLSSRDHVYNFIDGELRAITDDLEDVMKGIE